MPVGPRESFGVLGLAVTTAAIVAIMLSVSESEHEGPAPVADLNAPPSPRRTTESDLVPVEAKPTDREGDLPQSLTAESPELLEDAESVESTSWERDYDVATMTIEQLRLKLDEIRPVWGELVGPVIGELVREGRGEVIANLEPGVSVEARLTEYDLEHMVWFGMDPYRNQYVRLEFMPQEYPLLTDLYKQIQDLESELAARRKRILRHPDKFDSNGLPLK